MNLEKNTEMLDEILNSLGKPNKSISSKFFYDSVGCELFQRITELEEYYLTRCEKEILSNFIGDVVNIVNKDVIDIIEIGPGDGTKAALIAEQLIKKGQKFNFYGLDICEKALEELKRNFDILEKRMNTEIKPEILIGEFNQINNLLGEKSKNKRLVLFLGSSIGNLTPKESQSYMKRVSESLNPDDFLFVGFDLKKAHDVLNRAYNDAKGLTSDFNLNLLARFNRELKADFLLDQFYHHEIYDAEMGAMTSYLVSKCDQVVQVGDHSINFDKNEKIHTEYSFKYSHEDILALIENTGLEISQEFFDEKNYFSCVLFKKIHNPK
ncbi:MAG: L-histidine N(alpha)-methyltransferase [Pseudobdellovibrionaceae bacterium]